MHGLNTGPLPRTIDGEFKEIGFLSFVLSGAPDLVFPIPVLIGAIFVVCVLLFRRGLVGEIRDWAAHRTAG